MVAWNYMELCLSSSRSKGSKPPVHLYSILRLEYDIESEAQDGIGVIERA